MRHFEQPDDSEQDQLILDPYNRVKRLETIIILIKQLVSSAQSANAAAFSYLRWKP